MKNTFTIPLMRTAFIDRAPVKEHLRDFLDSSERLSMGQKCREFEKKFADIQEREDAVLFNSGGSANLALLQSLLNLGRVAAGDAIGYSALTWSTNIMPIIQTGMRPVPVDCDVRTLNVEPQNLIERLETDQIKVFFATNVLGFCGDLPRIRAICREKNILLIEDNCEALGTELDGGRAGNFGLASTFSFYIAHHLSTIEGGAVCTDDPELAEMLRIVRSNGWDRDLDPAGQEKWRKKYGVDNHFEADYTFFDLGFNFRPTELTAVCGLAQLPFLKESCLKRAKNYQDVAEVIAQNDELLPLRSDHIKILSNFAIPVLCKNPEIRQKYIKRFSGQNVEIRPIISGNMQLQPFYKKYVDKLYELKNTDFIHHAGFYCGNYPDLTGEDIKVIKDCLRGE